MSYHVTPLLITIHWHPISLRINPTTYKPQAILTLTTDPTSSPTISFLANSPSHSLLFSKHLRAFALTVLLPVSLFPRYCVVRSPSSLKLLLSPLRSLLSPPYLRQHSFFFSSSFSWSALSFIELITTRHILMWWFVHFICLSSPGMV